MTPRGIFGRRIALAALVVMVGALSSACFFRGLIMSVGISGGGGYPYYGDDEYTVTASAGSLVADCTFDTAFFGVGCIYSIYDDEGFLIDLVSTIDLITEFGLFGVFIDPLVLQVPQSVTGVSGTLNNGGIPVSLVITQTASFKAGPSTTVTAEPGMKLLIVELPPGAASSVTATDPHEGHEFDFTLQFTNTTLPIPVKSMFTVRVDAPGATYYLPMLPCTTDFGEVPAMSIGFTSAMAAEDEVRAMIGSYEGMVCDGQVYDLRTAPGPGDPAAYRLYAPGLAFN